MKKDQEIVECRVAGNTIKAAMKRKRRSQEWTAHAAGTTARQLTRILRGEHCPRLETAKALAVVLDVPLEELFQFKIRTRDTRTPPKGFDTIPSAF